MEAAIPISILAIGLARVYTRRSHLLENVIITTIGGVAGGIVAGAIFTLPALYTLKLHPHPAQTIFICLAGGCLGILFIIPLRRYFVKEMHGKFPFPEATAITEVLVTGEKGGAQAKLLIQATVISGIYDFFVTTFQVWKEYVDFQFLPFMKDAAEKAKVIVKFDAVAFILGLGYVMGLRASMILCAGGVLANFVLVPLIWMLGRHIPDAVYPALKPIAQMSAEQIYRGYVRLHRRRCDRDGRHLRHPEVAQDRRGVVRDRGEGVPERRRRLGRADGPRHLAHGDPRRDDPVRGGRRGLLRDARLDAHARS